MRVFEATSDGEQGVGIRLRPAASCLKPEIFQTFKQLCPHGTSA